MYKKTLPEDITKSTIALGKISLEFARTMRITLQEDGKTLESDTDHVFMLGLIACSFASKYIPRLDLGKVSQFALMHDLVEVYAGDTPTLKVMSQKDSDHKEEKEKEALDRIKKEFNQSFPWIASTIEEYETLASPEAKYIKAIDKLMPKITHLLNNGALYKRQGIDKKGIIEIYNQQREKMQNSYASDLPEVMELRERFIKEIYDKIFGNA
jgi:putative hydrolases of HD superfamily